MFLFASSGCLVAKLYVFSSLDSTFWFYLSLSINESLSSAQLWVNYVQSRISTLGRHTNNISMPSMSQKDSLWSTITASIIKFDGQFCVQIVCKSSALACAGGAVFSANFQPIVHNYFHHFKSLHIFFHPWAAFNY